MSELTNADKIEAGDELTIEYVDERTGDEAEKTVTAQRINDEQKVILADADGEEFGYIAFNISEMLDGVAYMETFGGVRMATIHTVTADVDVDESEEIVDEIEATKEARDAMEELGRDEKVEELEAEIEELEAELEDDDPEIVTDGGQDVTEHVDDETIEDAINRHDDPDHPDALTVDEVRDLLAELQLDFEEFWSEHMDTLEDGGLEVVEDTGDVVVFADHTGHGWGEELSALGVDGVARNVLMSVHHAAADRLTDHSWSTSDPFVIRKPNGDGGERYVQALVNGLQRKGLTPAQSWAVYGVHAAGYSRNAWASMCGHSDHSAVSQALRKINESTPYIALADR